MNLTVEELKLVIGESYILRSGLQTGPLRLSNNGTNYIYEAEVKQQNDVIYIDSFLYNGKYLTKDLDNHNDIIKKL
jgi:hypothetical protein